MMRIIHSVPQCAFSPLVALPSVTFVDDTFFGKLVARLFDPSKARKKGQEGNMEKKKSNN